MFIDKVNSVLEMSTLDSSKCIDTLWRQTWDKPLYADQFAYIASDLIDKLRAMTPSPLDNFRCLPPEPNLFKGLKRYTVKHRRLLALGAAWNLIFERHIATAKIIEARLRIQRSYQVVDFARQEMGAPGYLPAVREASFFDAVTAVKGFGQITALHISTDLGYPVYKPDRWLLRFAATDPSVRVAIENKLPVGTTLDHVTQSYLERHLELVMFAVDSLTEAFALSPQPQEIVDLEPGFRYHRFVDLMLAKFGMTPEKQFGIEISGKDLLLRDLARAQDYPQLFFIAQEMDRAIKAKMQKRRAKRQTQLPT
ncbi:hypothetical protein [Bordetella genomosp. 11]|uniref:Uncharacterized protein n=1 Tax=Bordetella genomosp. 11 TaxID=1416808 RepID=A0A261UMT7_9BORD|nr:hypothetical protein [Bordetella genomosp. 11]OZI63208.1 hypothetical protein CAL28_29435 [Bordetella genomosp. 11]